MTQCNDTVYSARLVRDLQDCEYSGVDGGISLIVEALEAYLFERTECTDEEHCPVWRISTPVSAGPDLQTSRTQWTVMVTVVS